MKKMNYLPALSLPAGVLIFILLLGLLCGCGDARDDIFVEEDSSGIKPIDPVTSDGGSYATGAATITYEEVYPDNHGEWDGGICYFPLRHVFINHDIFDIRFQDHFEFVGEYPNEKVYVYGPLGFSELVDSLNEIFLPAGIQFYNGVGDF